MLVQCPKCPARYNDVEYSTLCPHNRLPPAGPHYRSGESRDIPVRYANQDEIHEDTPDPCLARLEKKLDLYGWGFVLLLFTSLFNIALAASTWYYVFQLTRPWEITIGDGLQRVFK
jgi:hypothetical protein